MTDIERKKRKGRSPSYPGIDLQEAVEKAKKLYEEEGRSPAPVDAILDDWGYKPKSGAGLVAIAALKKFGLVEDAGSGQNRQARLTQLGLSILLAEPDSQQRADLIRKAALNPPIHSEVWHKYEGRLPSDASLRHYLEVERGFTPQGRKDFIRQFKSTVAFAKLEESGTMPEHEEPEEQEQGMVEPRPSAGTARIIQLPLPGTAWATLQGPFPLSEGAWKQMMAMLEVMKPALVEEPQPPNGHGSVQSSDGEEEPG